MKLALVAQERWKGLGQSLDPADAAAATPAPRAATGDNAEGEGRPEV